ncbi:von willebrand factor [Moniliophthora roreri MCA 2997]|uniref:von willebrand factor n=2 Tax=Moniliophthora roreri TaxID=221103 RepID=V2WYQ8_MONRO|nr:von willebrand factor [Moniliophthora roreri MCA 2997]KAI3615688.1 von willebrand factor [Moniliophthora roreri]
MGVSFPRVTEDLLLQLKNYDTVIVLDDSRSMGGSRWKQVEEALYVLAPLAAKYDEDGVDLHFLNNDKVFRSLTSISQVQEIFSSVSRSSGTPLGRKLRELLSSYVTRYETDKIIKPVMFLFITDGAPTDPEPENQTKTVILEFARKLDALNARLTQVGIQFLQVGNDESARRFLTFLDDNLKKENDVRDHGGYYSFKGRRIFRCCQGSVGCHQPESGQSRFQK